MFTALRAMFRDREGKVILAWAILQILIGTLMFRWLEHWSFINALYFSVVTLSTVGYGDLHPTTTAAKLFTVVYILFGLGALAAFISELTKYRASIIDRLRSRTSASDPDPGARSPEVTSPQPTTPDDDDRDSEG